MVDVEGERVQRAVEGDIARTWCREGGEQVSLLHEAAVRGWNKTRMGAKGAGDKVDGVADVVVEACLGVPQEVEEMIPMGVNALAAQAHWPGGGGKKRNAVGRAEGQDKGEVAETILADLPAGCE